MVRKMSLVYLALICAFSFSLMTVSAAPGKPDTGKVIWPKHQELPTFAKVAHLDVADLELSTGEEKLLFATLQGIVNREKPRIYLIEEQPSEGKYTWLNELQVPYKIMYTPWELLSKYKNEVEGVIVYDPDVPATVNVATTMAGLNDAVVASPEVWEKLAASPYNLKVIEDLRGRFADDLEAYRWQLENLWPQTSHRMLIGLSPMKGISIPSGIPEQFKLLIQEEEQIRDSSNRKVHDLDLSEFLGKEAVYLRFDDSYTEDGWGPAIHQITIKADDQVIDQFIPGTPDEEPFIYDHGGSALSPGNGGHRFADNTRYIVYRIAPPGGTQKLVVSVDMWNQYKVSAANIQPLTSDKAEPYGYLRDYAVANKAMVFWLETGKSEELALFEKILSAVKPGTPYLGWFANDVAGEWSGTELTSRYGVYVLAADWFNNLTVFSGSSGQIKKQQQPPAPKLSNKIYVTFTYTEGDNLQYNQHRMRDLWDNPARGSVPINWSTSPLLLDAAPVMLSYYQRTATRNDLLIAGPSGAGYFYPTPWPDESFSDFMKQSGKYMKRSGMDLVYALNLANHKSMPLSETEAQSYIDDLGARGVFLNWEDRNEITIVNGKLPLATGRLVGSVNDAKAAIAKGAEGWDGTSPQFISIGILAWNMNPEAIEEVAQSLGPEYEIVRGDHFFNLIRDANGLKQN